MILHFLVAYYCGHKLERMYLIGIIEHRIIKTKCIDHNRYFQIETIYMILHSEDCPGDVTALE